LTSDATRALGDVRIGGRRILMTPHNCFACGTLNVHGIQLDLHAGADRCWTELSLAERFEGWEGIAHGGIVTGVSALLARYTQCGEEGAVYGLDNSINSGARALAPMIGVSIAMWLGLRAVFGAISLLYLSAAALALWRLPRSVSCIAPVRETRP